LTRIGLCWTGIGGHESTWVNFVVGVIAFLLMFFIFTFIQEVVINGADGTDTQSMWTTD
jgi:hypothetical protein